MKFKSETITKALSWLGLCKAFAQKQLSFIAEHLEKIFIWTKMLSTMKSILPKPVMEPKTLEYFDDILPFGSMRSLSPFRPVLKSLNRILVLLISKKHLIL
jgi:hypothetical protein